ncbi:MAG: hypothetical protein M3Z17_06695, partial [Gemmatimonadota bacterium]|nr:hypothetical protein [Gemmatimonadota bacterium]
MNVVIAQPRFVARAGRLAAAFASVCIAALSAASVAGAHDFWLVPDAFRVASGSDVKIYGQTGTSFPVSTAVVGAERISDGRIISARGSERLGDFSQAGMSLVIRHRPVGNGQRVVAIALAPRSARQSAEAFKR